MQILEFKLKKTLLTVCPLMKYNIIPKAHTESKWPTIDLGLTNYKCLKANPSNALND